MLAKLLPQVVSTFLLVMSPPDILNVLVLKSPSMTMEVGELDKVFKKSVAQLSSELVQSIESVFSACICNH